MKAKLNLELWEKKEQIWYLSSERTIDEKESVFSDEQQKKLYEMEAESWWFQYRANVIIDMMKRFFKQNVVTIDVGGGNGYTSSRAKEEGYNCILLEPSWQACRNATERGLESYCGVLSDESIDDTSMEQILLLDVLEHIEEDDAFLRLLYKKMTDSALLLVTVPAFMKLWSSEDVFAKHFRRYRLDELIGKMQSAGFSVLYSNYFMQFLYLPILGFRVGLEKMGIIKRHENRSEEEELRLNEKQFKTQSTQVNKALCFFETREVKKLMNNRKIPFGSSIIVVLKKN